MNEDHRTLDSEQLSFLQRLMATPVGRRWLLKAGLGSAAAVANLPAWSTPSDVLAQTAPAASTPSLTGITLQFALGPALAGAGGAQPQPTASASPSATATPEAATPSTTPASRGTAEATSTPEPTRTAGSTETPATSGDTSAMESEGLMFGALMAAATNTPSSAPASSPTATPTARPSTPTATPTAHASATSTPAATASATPGATSTPTQGATATATATSSASPSPSPTGTPSITPTPGAGALTDLVLLANGAQLPLVAHTAESRATLRAQGGLWAIMDLDTLTHYVTDVPMPADRARIVSVQGTLGATQVLLAQLWYTPPPDTLALARLAAAGGALDMMVKPVCQLQALGLTADQVSSPELVAQLDLIGDGQSTAIVLAGLHPSVATKDPASVAPTKALLNATPSIGTLGCTITLMQHNGQSVATSVPVTEHDGTTPAMIQMKDRTTGNYSTSSFKTLQLNQTYGDFVTNLNQGVADGVKAVRNSGDLGQVIDKPVSAYPIGTPFKTWAQPQGVTPKPKPYTAPAGADAGGIQATLKVAYEPFQVPVSNGLVFGTGTQMTSGYSNGQVQLTIYNNYVRWLWAYVQYIGKDGKNLSTGPGKWPDTRYSLNLAVVPQVFTVLGVPLWDTNSVPVTLNFPQGAHTARLLYCGLGSNAVGAGWRQYFPADAYGGGSSNSLIAPQDEVLFPALMTGIFTIGLTAFALLTDLDIATTWAQLRKITDDNIEAMEHILVSLLTQAPYFTAAETFATTVSAGAATYEDVANGGGLKNIWNTLLNLCSAIPKILFNPANQQANSLLFEMAAVIWAGEDEDKLLEAVPLLGEVIGVILAVADVITLAESIGETLASPWVIENEVNLTYTATVTIEPDQRLSNPIWPATATSWQLTVKLDDAPLPLSQTGSMNVGGHTQSENLVLPIDNVPFGGSTIQWSFVVLDDAGNQVGTGVSGPLTNDDPSNPPTTVEFAITELPETISATTLFERKDTVTYSESAGGYTWSDQVTSDGTLKSSPIQEITGVSVSTMAGVVGVVWKQNDRYYVRSAPIAENGNTIPLSVGPKEGYARPPFLLLDALVGRQDAGNHVLLEPIDSSDTTPDGYVVRRVTLDPDTGAISWDSSSALGTFSLQVSAAALHSSGRVVTVQTDKSRVGWLHPVETPLPGLAAYTAGPGTQIGLLQSPSAVAVTDAGTVLILEAGANQLSSFDLSGSPTRYFGSNQDQYTQKLANDGTYLDLAVDGSGQIYLLYYTGDGSQADDYRVDVYTSSGAPLVTNSPGVNVAKLAVDYWRSIYAANFDPITDQGTTTPHIDPKLGVAEPSISRFDPKTPAS